MIEAIHSLTKERHEFGDGFLALKKLSEFMQGKNKDDYLIFLGRFEHARKHIMNDL